MEQKDLSHYKQEVDLKKLAEAEAFKTLEAAQAAANEARDARVRAEEALNMAIARVEQGLPADLGAQEATAPGSKVK